MSITVCLLTYNRLEYAKITLASAVKHLESNDHEFLWHIASDGDSSEYCEELYELLVDAGVDSERISGSNSTRGGYGKNYNLAMQVAHAQSDWTIPLEDDWELLRVFNPDPLIRDMVSLGIGCARLGYIGYTQQVRGHLMYGQAGHWFMFDPSSPEPHVFAGHPRIEHVPWSREVGPWEEGLDPGDTEFEIAHRLAARSRVAWPLDCVGPMGNLFAHVGAVRSY